MKAVTDPEFRAQLLADAKAALAALDIEIPDDVTINIVEDTQQTSTIAIPPATDTGILTRDEMEALWAGEGHPTCVGIPFRTTNPF